MDEAEFKSVMRKPRNSRSEIRAENLPVFYSAELREMRWSYALFVLALASLTLNMSATALELKRGKRVSYSEGSFLDDDLIATGATCRLAGAVDGDVLAFGKEVRNTGTISGILFAGGNSVAHSGEVRHSLVAGGRVVFLDGTVGGTSYALGETVEIGSEANLKRALYAICGYFVLDGEIGSDANVECESAVISGVVGGDLEIEAVEVEIRETATINGDLIVYCEEKNLFIDDDARIAGEIVRRDPESGQGGVINKSFLITRLYILSALLIIGLLVIAISHGHVRRATSSIRFEPLRSVAFGILVLAVGFTLTMILSFTFVGLPAAFLLFTALSALIVFVGQVYLVTAVGGLAPGNRKIDSLGGTIVSFLLGLVALGVILFVPYAGILAYLLAGLIGAGGFVAGLKERRDPVGPPNSTTPPLAPPPVSAA